VLQNFKSKPKSEWLCVGDRKIPNRAVRSLNIVIACGKVYLICGKHRLSLWNICGIYGENSTKR